MDTKYYEGLAELYLAEAEEMFGKRIGYRFDGLRFHNLRPQVIQTRSHVQNEQPGFMVMLNGHASHDEKDGIFQLAHEVIHLLSPVAFDDKNELNYLEEGLAVYFSKFIVERETGDLAFCNNALEIAPVYAEAFRLYSELNDYDPNAVRKLRDVHPIIATLKLEHFKLSCISAPQPLLEALLTKF